MILLARRKWWLVLAIAAIAADVLLKLILPTEAWAYHRVEPRWHYWLGLVVIALLIAWVPTRLGGVLLMAGALGNLAWSWSERGTPNPFVGDARGDSLADVYTILTFEPGPVAYNLADVWVTLGCALWLLGLTSWLIGRAWQQSNGVASESK